MEPVEIRTAKDRARAVVGASSELLVEVARQIHERPEEAFEERFAHDLLTEVLDEAGLDVERGAYGLPTAFAARAGTEGPLVAVCCEYDALPGLGHACGHNLIAAAGLGAGLAAAAVAEQLGGRVVVLGTPAEEGGGGKVLMQRAGAFDDVVAAMMVHPADADLLSMDTLAVHICHATYTGVAAHAAAHPHLGRNALDAAVLGYVGVAALRQHMRPEERVHGVLLRAGDKPNIVPAHAESEWYVRTARYADLPSLEERLAACLEGGALQAGCEVALEWQDPAYAEMVDDSALLDLYVANSAVLGRSVQPPAPDHRVVGSTDMGNVSKIVPSIHPMVQVAPPGVGIHTPAFADHAIGDAADRAVVDGAAAMAMTIVDVWSR